MSENARQFRTAVLAGERPGGSALSRAFNVSASVMVPVAGQSALARVLGAVHESRRAIPAIICGPAADAVGRDPQLERLLAQSGFEWRAPEAGPAASAVAAVTAAAAYPVLLTAGDHALLQPAIIDDFCTSVDVLNARQEYDFVIGFVPHALVRSAWPQSKRTVLRFSDGGFCGSNLFAVLNPDGLKALAFWRRAEADRKHPWRIARRFGLAALIRYVLRRLSLPAALESLSTASGCRIGWVAVEHARAAVDVDSVADQQLAHHILSGENPDLSFPGPQQR